MYCQLVDDLEGFVYSQADACMNGLNGRLTYSVILVLKAQLQEGIKDVSRFSKAFLENVLALPSYQAAIAQIEVEETEDANAFLKFCDDANRDKREKEELISQQEKTLMILERENEEYLSRYARPLPFKFNPTFLGALEDVPAYVDRPVGTPSNYQFVVDPAQRGRQWGARRVVKKGDGHVAVEGDGYVFYYQIPTAEMKLLHGKQFRFEVDALSHTPGAYIQYWGYRNANSEKIKSYAHPGDGSWQTLSLDFTIDENDTMHFLYPIILPAINKGLDAPIIEVKNVRLKQP
jgi:hypothetical protein